ncbi:MAG: SDR family NAD(P)-dependent oxidoreductase [Anaerolineae bacterium]|jgi:NAD(P)-dependent dehydrogenase (short-subunit alcohol dehydrogenase family)|nr:SDR family NAD(P)-dependent oxidoreductase [Chloroflexota bacterium]
MTQTQPSTEPIALVTGADRGLGQALTAALLARGWRVFAGQYMPEWPQLGELAATYPLLSLVPLDVSSDESVAAAARSVAQQADRVDLIINCAGVLSPHTDGRSIREEQDYDEMHRMYRVNALGPLRVVEAFLPLVEPSALKRLCFISSEAGSINRAERTSWFGYCSSKTALNMAVRLLFNRLRPRGYTFRLYHPGWMRTYMSGQRNEAATLEPEQAAVSALGYFLQDRGYDPHLAPRNDEDRLVLRDNRGVEWPF